MNIYDDKTLYKLISGIGFVIFSVAIIPAFINGGPKAALFVFWLGIAIAAFLVIVALIVEKISGDYSSGGFVRNYANIWFDMNSFKAVVSLVFIILLMASAAVWGFLDRKMPNQKPGDLPVSELPDSHNFR